MTPDELRERTIEFAVRVLKFADALPNTASGRAVSNQVARSGGSVAANYRAALRGKSRADFTNKITIVLEERDLTRVKQIRLITPKPFQPPLRRRHGIRRSRLRLRRTTDSRPTRLIRPIRPNRLPPGCNVFHDLQTGEIGNLDHIVVSPAGVFLVETKTNRKKRNAAADLDYQVIYDGRRLQFPNGTDEEKLAQTKRNAAWLAEFLTAATGEAVKVNPVLTLPGWWGERKARNGVAVLNQKEIRSHVLHRDGPAMPEAQQRRIVHQLDQKCRDIEF